MTKSPQPISEVEKEPLRSTRGKLITGIRLLEGAALIVFAVLMFIGWSYHGRNRPWGLDACIVFLLAFCGVIEFLLWVISKIRGVSN